MLIFRYFVTSCAEAGRLLFGSAQKISFREKQIEEEIDLDESKEELLIAPGEQNRIRVIIPAGYNGTIKIRFCEPWYWRISELISVIGVIMILICFKKNRDIKKEGSCIKCIR